MRVLRFMAACGLTILGMVSCVWGAVDTTHYEYDSRLQVIRVDYDGSAVVDYTYDGAGNRMHRTIRTDGAPVNHPPTGPTLQSPANGATNVSAVTSLIWAAADPDNGDLLLYDIYLGPDPGSPKIKSGQTTADVSPNRLLPMTTYYWKVVARDNHNAQTQSAVWSFTTGNEPPNQPVCRFPVQGSTVDYGNAYLSWSADDADIGDSLTYDVHFGTDATPPLVQGNISTTTYDVGTLSPDTTYYWQIVAKDRFGGITPGPIGSFRTLDHEPVRLGTNISGDTTLTQAEGPYLLPSSLTVDAGVTLTIEPGTIIKLALNGSITVNGRLDAQGTETDPIIFTSITDDRYGGDTNGDGDATPPDRGDWQYLRLKNSADDSRLEYVKILYSGDSSYGALWLNGGATTIHHCTIAQSASYGIDLGVNAAMITNTTFTDNFGYDLYTESGFSGAILNNIFNSGISITINSGYSISANTFHYDDKNPVYLHPNAVGKLFADNTIDGLTKFSCLNVGQGTINSDSLWPASISYCVLGNITIAGTSGAGGVATLSLEPGAELRFNPGKSITVGTSSAPGAIAAVGTSDNPIIFTSNSTPKTAGDWVGVHLYNMSDDNLSRLENCIIEYAGYAAGSGIIEIADASPTIMNCTIRFSLGYGIRIRLASAPVIRNCTISNCAGYGIYSYGDRALTVSGNTFIDNGDYDIYLSDVPSGSVITDNIINNSIDISTGTVVLTGNTFNNYDTHPIVLRPDDVGEFMMQNTINGLSSDSYVTVLGGSLTIDAKWPAVMPYVIQGHITINGTSGDDNITELTINPGAEIRFNNHPACYLAVTVSGILRAVGTESEPILFTSNNKPPSAGIWGGIRFGNNTSGQLEHCIIEYTNSNIIYCSGASPSIVNCTLRHSKGNGIQVARDGSPQIDSNCISDCLNDGVLNNGGNKFTINDNTFDAIGGFDINLYSTPSGSVITNNMINSGINVNNGTVIINGNFINYDKDHPIRLDPEDVGELFDQNNIGAVPAGSYLRVESGVIVSDAVWPALMPYHLIADVSVEGRAGEDGVTTLTIAPGAELKFNENRYLAVGTSTPGALMAVGTDDRPILFTANSNNKRAGYWQGITFANWSSDSSCMDNCIIEYAGSGSTGRNIYIDNASPTIKNCIIRHSEAYGIHLTNSSGPLIDINTFSDCGSHAIYHDIYNTSGNTATISNNRFTNSGGNDIYLRSIPSGTVITGNEINNGIAVTGNEVTLTGNIFNNYNLHPIALNPNDVDEFLNQNTINGITADSYLAVHSGTLSQDARWGALLPFHIEGNLYVWGTAGTDRVTTLTIDPGAKLKFQTGNYKLSIGSGSNPGALQAFGTIDDPILFTSNAAKPVAGNWGGLFFQDGSNDSICRLDNCIIEYAGRGNNGSLIRIEKSSPTLTNSYLRNSSSHGIYINDGSCEPVIRNSTITQCAQYGIFARDRSLPVIAENRIFGNSEFGLYRNYPLTLIAENNWWGDDTGPYHPTANPGGLGDRVSDYVDFTPWTTGIDASDVDADTLPDDWEMTHFGNLTTANATSDADGDGLRDIDELAAGTDPTHPDTDGDAMPDAWEIDHGLIPVLNDALADADGDGVTNLKEYLSGTDPWDDQQVPGILADFDLDGDTDGNELATITQELGRSDCSVSLPCDSDLDLDGDVDDVDLQLLLEDLGK